MRSPLLCALVFAATLTAQAQETTSAASGTPPPAGSNWQRVQALPVGTSVHVNARTSHALCSLTGVDEQMLSCSRDTGVGRKPLTFRRDEIQTIKLARRGRSAVLGGIAGAGAGALAGGIQGSRSNYFAVKGAFAMIYGFAGGFAGAPIGYLTDFRASTIYRAP